MFLVVDNKFNYALLVIFLYLIISQLDLEVAEVLLTRALFGFTLMLGANFTRTHHTKYKGPDNLIVNNGEVNRESNNNPIVKHSRKPPTLSRDFAPLSYLSVSYQNPY